MDHISSNSIALTRFQKEIWLSHLALSEKHPGFFGGGVFILNSCPEKNVIYKGLALLQGHFPLISATLRKAAGKYPVFETGVYPEPDVTFLDFRSESDPEKRAEEWLAEFREKGFNPLGGSLYRSALIYIKDDLSWFVNTCFHIAGDGFFCVAQAHLLMEYYEAFQAGLPFELPPVPSWEKDVEEDRKHLLSPGSQDEAAAWLAYLQGLPRERVFTPIPGRPDDINTIGQLDVDLSLSVTEKISQLASFHQTNTSQVFVALHAMILSCLYDKNDFCIQVPLRFGEKRDLKKVQGHRVQIAPLIIHLNDNSTFKTILQSVRQQFRTIVPLLKTPFQTAFRELENAREMSHIWDTAINHIPFFENPYICAKYPVNSKYDPFLLGIYIIEPYQGQGLTLSIRYSINHFTPEQVKNYVARLEHLICKTIENPEIPVSRYHCLLGSELQTLKTFQQGPSRNIFDGTIPERFDEIASLNKDKVAVCGEERNGTGGLEQTYLDLKKRSDSVAVWLSENNVRPGQVVAVFARRDARLPEIILGIMKAGGVYLPIDPDYPESRICHMLEDSAARVAIAMEKEDANQHKNKINVLIIPSSLPVGNLHACSDEKAPAYLIYTSGSTGKAKGVLISHGGFLNMIEYQISTFGIQPGERVLQFASPSFDASLSEIFMSLLGGGTLYPVSRNLIDAPWDLKAYLTKNRITVVTFPPSYLRLFKKEAFSGLNVMITAGEPPIAEDARCYASQLKYFNAYGPTEASVCASITQVDPYSPDSFISIGKPIPNTSVYILDSKGRQTAPGIPGELSIKGKGLAIGYLNQPELNQTRFVSPAFAPEERVYRTGDYAAWTEKGELFLMGRIDDQVKIRGHRIELGEINTVLEQQKGVSQAVTIAVPDSMDRKILHTFLVPVSGVDLNVQDLIDELKVYIPHFMIPARFHLMEKLPVSPTGKVDKHALAKLINPSVWSESLEKKTGFGPEEEIRVIFERILNRKVPALTADFFSLGGDSITAIELIHQIDRCFNCSISMREIMDQATVMSVAGLVSKHFQEHTGGCHDHFDNRISLNQGQYQLWVQSVMAGASACYNMPFALQIKADENQMNAFCESLEKAIKSQPSFHACVVVENDEPYLELSAPSGFQCQYVDLRHDSSSISKVEQIFDTAIHEPFDLSCSPLIRSTVVRTAEEEWRLLVVIHHIIGDGESIKKLFSTCLDILNEKPVNPISPLVLKRFIDKEKDYLVSSDAQKDFSFWKEILTPLPERINFFPHQNRPPIKTAEGNLIRYPLPPEALKGLITLSEQTHTTLFVSFLSILMEFIKERTGKSDVAICVPAGLRDTSELMDVAGYFVNLVVLRSSSDRSVHIQDAVSNTWESFRKAMAHSRYPFGLLPLKLNLAHDPSRSPLTDIIATHMDMADFIPENDIPQGMSVCPLPVSLRASKTDYVFILSTGASHDETDGQQTKEMELALEYNIHLASPDEAANLLMAFGRYIENRVTQLFIAQKEQAGFFPEETEGDHTCARDLVSFAWKKVLGGDPDENSNFFECGGDSIKAIQMVANFRQNNITGITPSQIFQHPTFSKLITLVAERDKIKEDTDIPVTYHTPGPGEFIDLLPIQERMFRQQKDHWKTYHMVLPLSLSEQVNIQRIPEALKELTHRHEAFQVAFLDHGKGLMLKQPAPPVWETLFIDEPVSVETAVQRGAETLFQHLEPSAGRLFGAVIVRTGSGIFLILGGHHLVLDAVSLDILSREISWYCHTGEWPDSDIRPGIATWSHQLAMQHNEFPSAREKVLWKDICAHVGAPLSAIISKKHDMVSNRISRTRILHANTFQLSSNPRSKLLAGLSIALHAQGQRDPVFVTLEGHGRENIFPHLDISQSVGWFTTTFPMLLTPSDDVEDAVTRISDDLDGLPYNGLGYGILYQHTKERENYRYLPQITFNYLGQIFSEKEYHGFTALSMLTQPWNISGLLDEHFYFDTPLDISVFITPEGSLQLTAAFSPECLPEEWIDALLLKWESSLKCMTPENDTAANTHIPPLWAELAEQCLCSVEQIASVSPPLLTQEGMLFQHIFDDGAAGTYTQQIHFRLKGEINRNIFKQAWDILLDRHGALRTLYPFDHKGECHCLMLKKARITMEMTDLSTMPLEFQQSLRDKKISELKQQSFDLSKGPLFQIHLFSFGTHDHEMSLHFHHILMDGWCMGILLRELFTTYADLVQNIPVSLDPSPDLNAYKRFLSQFDRKEAKEYWQDLLNGFSRHTYLAQSNQPQADAKDDFQEREWHLDRNTTSGLKKYAADNGVTLPNLLQAAWSILLSRCNDNCRDTLFGIVSSGRPAQVNGMEHMVGMFIQTLPVRARWQDSESPGDLSLRLQQQAMERTAYEYYPLADIQRLLNIRSPLFDHILVFENYPVYGIEQAHAPRISGVSGFEQHPYAFSLSVIPGNELAFRFSCPSAFFSESEVERIKENWQNLLSRISQDHAVTCNDLETLIQPQLIYPVASLGKSVHDLFSETAAKYPNQTALIGPDGMVWKYEKLDRISSAVAKGLGCLSDGEVIAFILPREPAAVAAMLGILKAGGVYLPLDEKTPPKRIRKMLEIASCDKVVLYRNSQPWLEKEYHACFYETLAESDHSSFEPLSEKSAGPLAGKPAYIMFTSGSTGEPKGVVIPHQAILRLVIGSNFWDISPGERVLQAGPLGFDASTLEIWGPLLNRATVSFISDDALLSPVQLKKKIEMDRVSLMWLTASLCNLLADEDAGIFASLRRLMTGGEALSPPHMKKIMDACPLLEIMNGYGPTENTTFTTTHILKPVDVEKGNIPIGRPISNTRVYILDEEHKPVPDGEWGEICAAGDGLALGYIGRDDLTQKVFINLPAPVSERVYKTGDIGRRNKDGLIEYKGRKDAQVKIRGYRIELSEIETALLEIPFITRAAVVAPQNNAYRTLVAWVQTDKKQDYPEQEIREDIDNILKQVLPGYMIPDKINFTRDFPITRNGKLDRAELTRRTGDAPQVDTENTDLDSCSIIDAKWGHFEHQVADAYADILKTTVDAPDADFFKLGGQSLLLMRLMLRLNHEFDIQLNIRDVMTHTTVKALARKIRELKSSGPVLEIMHTGTLEYYPLSRGQERLWFLQRMYPDSAVYGVPFVVRLKGDIDRDALQHAITLLETWHEALRMRVPEHIRESALALKIVPPGQTRLAFKDCSGADDPEQATAIAVDKEINRAFSFGFDSPLVRATLFKETSYSHVLLLNFHHMICDGWSGKILIQDLHQAYEIGINPNTEHPLRPAQPIRYVDYAAWQKNFLSGPDGVSLQQRWLERLSSLPDALNLPGDRQRPLKQSFKGASYQFNLSPEQKQGLTICAGASGTTLFTVLLALVKTFLFRHTGEDDVLIGVPVAGRDHWQLENLVGFFVNTIVLRTRLSVHDSFDMLVKQVKNSFEDALADQAYPFEALVENLNLPREASRNPLFDILVSFEDKEWNFQNTESTSSSRLNMTPYHISHKQSKVDMSFYFRETRDGLCVDIEYNTDLFNASTIARMAERFKILTDAVLNDAHTSSGQSLETFDIMPDHEREQVIHTFNHTFSDIDLDQSIDDLFTKQVQKTPNATALCSSKGECLSYEQLNHRVNALVLYLKNKGVRKGSYVGVSFYRSFDLMTSIFAILRIGAVYVPFIPELPSERIASMKEDLDGVVMVTHDDLKEVFLKNNIPVILFPETAEIHNAEKSPVSPDDIAYIIFTSGSTGRPKGVPIKHQSVINRIQWMQSVFPLKEKDVILQKTPISFDVSVWELFWWSWSGATLAQLPPGHEKDPSAIVDAVERHGVTVMHFVPSMLRMFLSHIQINPDAIPRLKTLKYVFASGEALTSEVVALFNTLLYTHNKTELHNLYGPTEATVDVTWYPCSPFMENRLVPIGRPVSNTRIYILDFNKMPVPIGVVGDIYISGIQVSPGYVNRPELTAAAFETDPFYPGDRMYCTGDRGRWLPEGDVEYHGRRDNQVKIRGFRIELGEVEAALERLENVRQAIVRVGTLGGLPTLEAFLVCPEDSGLSLETIRGQVADFLPDYMMPSTFFRIDRVPLNASGKADRKALTGELLFFGKKSGTAQSQSVTPLEKKVLGIWQKVFPELAEIHIHDRFFDIGGNSLLVIKLQDYLDSAWPNVFSIADLFVRTTIHQQAEYIDENINDPEKQRTMDKDEHTFEVPLFQNKDAVAVIGMALRLADYETPEGLWSDLLSGTDRTGPMPESRLKEYSQLINALGYPSGGGQIPELSYLDDVSGFDCKRFGLAPADVRLMDPEFRLFVETAFRALEEGGYGGNITEGGNLGIFAGASPSNTFKQAMFQSFPGQAEQSFVLNIPSGMVTRLGYMKNWKGPASLVDTACSSSLKAIQDACQSLISGECSMALAGGARIMLTPLKSEKNFSIETKKGKTRPFDINADGVGGGEGSIVFLLKPLSHALADHDAIHGIILGGAVNQDGRSAGIAAPNPVAQANVIARAAGNAGVDLSTLDFFEAHGTGTEIGDPIEIDGLTRAFKIQAQLSGKTFKPDCQKAIGSVKGNFGHLDAAAGALGMAKSILCLEHGMVPGQIHFNAPNPRIDFNQSPVFVNQIHHSLSEASRPWRCGVSSFGMSGINVHMILEQAPERIFSLDDGTCHIVPLSSGSEQGLMDYAEQILKQVADHPEWPLHAISGTLTTGRDHLPFRLAIPAVNRDVFLTKLKEWRFSGAHPVTPVTPLKERICLSGLPYWTDDDHGFVEKACQAFLSGAEPAWPEKVPVYRVHLPQSPMNRTPCWPKFREKAYDKMAYRGFLESGIQTDKGWMYKVPAASEAFWPMSEHRLGDTPALVGMAAVPLFTEAFKRIHSPRDSFKKIVVKGLNWLKPMMREQIEADSIVVKLQKQDNGVRASLYGSERNGEWGDYVEAVLMDSSFNISQKSSEPEKLNLKKVLTEFSEVLDNDTSDDKNIVSDRQFVSVSSRWGCRTRKWQSEDGIRTLALLELPQAYLGDLQNITPHPAMLDVAASLALDRAGMVPAGCGEIYLFRPMPSRLYAMVTKHDQPESKGTSFLQVDCCLWDAETREPVLEIKNMMFVPVQLPRPHIHGLQWVEQKTIDFDFHTLAYKRWMLIFEDKYKDPVVEGLIRCSQKYGIETIKETIPVNDTQRESLALKINTQDVTHIFYRVPLSETDRWTLPALMKALCNNGLATPLQFVAAGCGGFGMIPDEDTDPKFPDAALTMGVMLSLAQEEPMLNCRYIEMGRNVPEESILAEVFATSASPLSPVMLDSYGKRYVRDIGPALDSNLKQNRVLKEESHPIVFENGSCIVFTGGLGAMSLTLAEAALASSDTRVALIHRGEFPGPEIWDTMTENTDPVIRFRGERLKYLQEKGLKIRGYHCDVCSREVLHNTLCQVREEMGPIGGVIHTAGIPGDGFLIRKSRNEFERTLAPKVDAVINLHDLTLDDPLRFFVMASSRTALTGAPGQTDYTAANAWMDAFAHWRRRKGLTALSINWNTWADVGMAAWNNVPVISGTAILPKQALSVFEQSLALKEAQVVVSMPGEPSFSLMNCMNRKGPLYERPIAENIDKALSFDDQILQIISQTLGYDTPLSGKDDFYELGGDSITGVRVVNRINEEFGQSVNLADLYSHSELSDFIKTIKKGKRNSQGVPVLTAPANVSRYPVSREQLAVLRIDALSIPNTGYNLPQFLELPEGFDPQKMESAIRQLIKRHDILRTRFLDIDTECPVMEVLPELAFSLHERQIHTLDSVTVEELVKPFQLARAPLFRARLLKTEKSRDILFFDIHHAVADARTVDILLTELYALYKGRALDRPGPQQKDAAWAQHFQERPETQEAAKAYWLNQFSNPLPYLDLPADYPRPEFHTFVGATTQFVIPEHLIPAIRSLARRHATTTYTLMLSLWAILLSRYAGKRKLVISVAADSREGEMFASTTGMFASLLPLQINVDERQSIGQLLHRNHQLHADAIRHKAFPLSQILAELKPPMRPERTVLSEVTFSYMNFRNTRLDHGKDQHPEQAFENDSFKTLFIANPACKSDIAIFATDIGDRLSFALEYYADLFSSQRMEKMGQDFLSLLKQVLDYPPGKQSEPLISQYRLDFNPDDGQDVLATYRKEKTSAKISQAGDVDEPLVIQMFRTIFNMDFIGKDDSFFDLGGHSLLGLQIINRINKETGTLLTIRHLFENPTPAMLADLIARSRADSILPVKEKAEASHEQMFFPEGCYPLSHAQQRLYVLHYTHGGNTAYNMPFVFHFRTPLNKDRFQEALNRLCQRHEILRTAFLEIDGQIWQKVYPDGTCPFSVHQYKAEEYEKALALFREDTVTPFDLKNSPLFKIRICHLGNDASLLFLLMHHIIGDGWSMQIFFKELMLFYDHEDKKARSVLSPLSIQYKDYAIYQQNKNWESEAQYWKKKLLRAPDRIALPVDGSGQPKTLPVGVCQQEVPAWLMPHLRKYARDKRVSLATLFLSVFSALLYRLTRQEDMVIGMGVAGRELQEIEGLIGFFVNILPIRVMIDDDTEFESLLDQIHVASLEALERQGYPFDLLIREVSPDRKSGREALINVMFEYQRFSDVKDISITSSDSKPFETTLIDLYGKTSTPMDVGPAARHDLTFFVQDSPDGCMLRVDFDRGILCAETVETWLKYFEVILSGIIEEKNENI